MPKDGHNSDEEPKPKFKIVDRRRVDDEGPSEPARDLGKPKAAPQEEATAPQTDQKTAIEEPALDEEPEAPEAGESIDPLAYRNIALSFLQTLSTIAWIQMGLVPNPQTQLIAKKMEEARKAIGLFELIFQQSKAEFPPEINVEITGLLQDMKANYVNQL